MTDYEQNIISRLEQLIFEGKIKNECLVQTLNLIAEYLNLQSISNFEKTAKESYQGILKSPKFEKIKIDNKIFIIDNG